jgi:multiple sugar transport system ATP-binding protein
VEAMTMGTRICVMNAGELQQVDTPFNLYHNPRNLFVAGFIGSPSMNFFDATLKEADGRVVIETSNGFTLPIPANKAEPFRSHLGKRVIFGIRPEDIHDVEYQPTNISPAIVEANVDVIEQMGNEMILYLEDQGKSFIARTDPRTRATIGKRMGIVLNIDNMHLFDAETNQSLAFEYKAAGVREAAMPV